MKRSISLQTGLMVLALSATTFLCAQTPTPAPSTTPSTTQPATTPNKGWTMFDQRVGDRLQLKGDQLQRLQEVDKNYNDRYTAMGRTPWTAPGYQALTDQRNRDVQKILTPAQYDQWTSTYGPAPSQTPKTGTTMPKTTKP